MWVDYGVENLSQINILYVGYSFGFLTILYVLNALTNNQPSKKYKNK